MLAEPRLNHIHIHINICRHTRHNIKLNYINGLPTSIFMGYFVEMRAGSGKEVHK
jgi:hypothetical protein